MKTKLLLFAFVFFAHLSFAQTEVSGNYVVRQISTIKDGKIDRFPNKGINHVFRAKVLNKTTVEFTLTTYKRGKQVEQQVFKGKLKKAANGYIWNEIWDNGAWITDGNIVSNVLVVNMTEKATNELISTWTAYK